MQLPNSFSQLGLNGNFAKGSFLNDISIEGIDENGRATLKSLHGRDSTASIGGGLKWKRKSELSKSIASSGKSRISIKGNNQYEYYYGNNDPFNASQQVNIQDIMQDANHHYYNNSNDGQKPQFEELKSGVSKQNAGVVMSRPSLKLGATSEQRMSRISQII